MEPLEWAGPTVYYLQLQVMDLIASGPVMEDSCADIKNRRNRCVNDGCDLWSLCLHDQASGDPP